MHGRCQLGQKDQNNFNHPLSAFEEHLPLTDIKSAVFLAEDPPPSDNCSPEPNYGVRRGSNYLAQKHRKNVLIDKYSDVDAKLNVPLTSMSFMFLNTTN